MADPVIKSPSEYAKIPAGTRVSYGPKGVVLSAAKLLQSAMAIGATGKKGAFVKVTRLIDKEPKYMADMGEGEDKTFVFIDDPSDENQTALLADAKLDKTVVFFMEFPNGRISEVEVVLAGWTLQSVDAPDGKVLQVEVYGKQNSVNWTASPSTPVEP
ncbi:phage tail protein [Yersinia kristensenii]|nr:phage tail protein [Yersinia kristensenii]